MYISLFLNNQFCLPLSEEADNTDEDDVDQVDAITQSLPLSDIGLSASRSQGTLWYVSSVLYTICN